MLNVLIVANMEGFDKLAYVIGKYANPRCLKYFSSRHEWLPATIWENILDRLNHKMALHGRKIILLLDNATVHRSTNDYPKLKAVFLPKNTTSLTQPPDQGPIRTKENTAGEKDDSYNRVQNDGPGIYKINNGWIFLQQCTCSSARCFW